MEKKLLRRIILFQSILQILAMVATLFFLWKRVPEAIYANMEEVLSQEKNFYLQMMENEQGNGNKEDDFIVSTVENLPTTKEESLIVFDAQSLEFLGGAENNDLEVEIKMFGDRARVRNLLKGAENGKIHRLGNMSIFVKTKPVDDMIFVSLHRPGVQMKLAVWMFFYILIVLSINIVVVTALTRNYFRRYVFAEIDSIKDNIQKMINGSSDVTFTSKEDTEFASITTALDEWSKNIRNIQSKINWCMRVTSPKVAVFEGMPRVNVIYYSENFRELSGASEEEWSTIDKDASAFIDYIGRLIEKKSDGVVEVGGRFLRIELHQMEQDYFGILIDQTEEVLAKKKELNALKIQAETDSLTELLNRRGFRIRVEKILETSRKTKILLLFDVDNFKQVNDTMGHPIGDRVLKTIASYAKKFFGEEDIMARIGGDEFAVFINGELAEPELCEMLERFQKGMREALQVFGRMLSVSIGAAWITKEEAGYRQLYQCADRALYISKEEGKNRFTITGCCNKENRGHLNRIVRISGLLTEALAKNTDRYALGETEIENICKAAFLHDIGKRNIPVEILNKKGKLTPEEFELIKTHTLAGAEMIAEVPPEGCEALLDTIYEVCRWHHERYDGKGYPDGLLGEEIPISAQIVGLADVYEALTSERVYKEAYSHEKAVKMILGGECGAFSKLLLDAFLEVEEILKEETDGESFDTHRPLDRYHMAEEFFESEEWELPQRILDSLQ